MQEERDALVKLFRRLALEGRKKNVIITLLDLRWGITDNQKRNGQVISTCLQEIDNSRPFFIGLIGERYGWIPSSGELEGNPELLSRFPEISKYSREGLSITEIEMRHGVLDAMRTQRAIFLMKKGVQPESEKHEKLIHDIDKSENTDLFEYSSIHELTKLVEKEFTKIIEENEKEVSEDNHEQIREVQERILLEKSEGHVSTGNYKDKLDEWLNSDENKIVITGDKGTGKTSLIASWIEENANKFDRVIYYFIGEGGKEDSPLNVQKYILGELEKYYSYDFQIDENEHLDWDDDYSITVEHGLSMGSQHNERLLLVIDGLDHIQNKGIDKFLYWLPDIPDNVKAIFTTSHDDTTFYSLNEIKKFPIIELSQFNYDETKKIIVSYLRKYGKQLDDDLVGLIASNSLFRNGSMLRILLDDLVAYGVHEQLPAQISKYASSQDKQTFFNLIIERAEEFYGIEKIEKILTLLLISKNGFNEIDIRDILRLEPLEWSEIFCGLRNYLVFVDGKFSIRYDELKEAVISRYSHESSSQEEDKGLLLSKAIVCNLKSREGEEEEIAFQAFTLEDAKLLHDTLAPYNVAKRLVTEDEAWMGRYWTLLEENGYSFSEYLDKIPDDKEEWGEYGFYFSQFADLDLNNPDLAIEFVMKYLAVLGDTDEDEKDKIDVYLYMARLHDKHGDIENTEKKLELAKPLLDKHYAPDDWNHGSYYFALGNLLYTKREFEKALEAHRHAEELELKNKNGDESNRWSSLNRIGMDLIGLERYDEAIEAFRHALQFVSTQMTTLSFEASQILNNIGYCLLLQEKDLTEAETHLQKALGQMTSMFGEYNMELFLTVTNLVELYLKQKEFEKAREACLYAYNILEKNEDLATEEQMAIVSLKAAESEFGLGNYDDSIKILKDIIKNLAYNEIVQQAYDKLGEVYYNSGKLKEIIKLYEKWDKEAWNYYDGINYISAYARKVMGNIYSEMGKFKKAFKEYETALAVYVELGDEEAAAEIREALG